MPAILVVILKNIAMKFTILFLSVLCLGTSTALSQLDGQVKTLIFQKDSLFWLAYNGCDVEGMSAFITDDVEFYHDMGGVTKGKDSMVANIRKNLCGNENFRLRREAVKGTVNVYVMKKSDVPYGAVISGQHVFYINEKDKKEYLDGLARFSQLWILDNGEWKMSRILSYDHGPAPHNTMRTVKQVSDQVLKKHSGSYKGPQTGDIKVVNENNALRLIIGDKQYVIYPESDDLYFSKERDLEFIFSKDKMTVKERGQVVEETARVK
jgi:hypothetical protein